ncbi:MAG: hypothetical protein ACUVRY_02095 [Thermoanaerobaculaceae bacterium]
MKSWKFAVLFGVLVGAAAHAQNVPTPGEVVRRACEAAGGLPAFANLGFLRAEMASTEVIQDGKTSEVRKVLVFSPESIAPVRLEIPSVGVVAGDDGTGGWALINNQPDPRPTTTIMVKRMVTADAFPLTLPFSLNWPGVTVSGVMAATLDNTPTWRLSVTLARSFFHTPQIATRWTVDIDQRTFQVLRAESPYTDLGKGVVADGMRFTWAEFRSFQGVRLPTQQLVVGLDRDGKEKAHHRRDVITWQRLSLEQTAGLFENPVPPELRPKLPVGKPVSLPQQAPPPKP